MKQATKYGFAALLGGILLLGACSKDETIPAGDASTGTLRMHITATRAETDAYDPFDYRTVRIYSDKGLIRKYAPQDEMPAELQLLQGDYRIGASSNSPSRRTGPRRSRCRARRSTSQPRCCSTPRSPRTSAATSP